MLLHGDDETAWAPRRRSVPGASAPGAAAGSGTAADRRRGLRVVIVGSGRLARVLGQRLVGAGHQVLFAREEPAARAVAPPGTATVNVDAVGAADVVVLAVSFGEAEAALAECGPLDGTLVWSCVNATNADGGGLAVGFDDSAAETMARLVPGARVVAALPPCPDVLADPGLFGGVRPSTWVCGESRTDKSVVAGLLESVGVEPIDAGGLDAARLIEPAMMLVHRQANGVSPPRRLALRLVEQGWDQLDRPSSILT